MRLLMGKPLGICHIGWQHHWHQGSQQDVEGISPSDPERDGKAEILEQHRRAGSPLHQETNPPDTRLQVFYFSFSDSGRHRGRAHEPQRAIHIWALPLSTIQRTGRLTNQGRCISTNCRKLRNRTLQNKLAMPLENKLMEIRSRLT